MRRGSVVARWGRFALVLGLTALLLVPVLAVLVRAFTGPDGDLSASAFLAGPPLGQVAGWLLNSTFVTAATVVVTTAIAAPAGYVLSRVRNRATTAFALLVFGLQSLPVVVLLVPLFLVVAGLRGADRLSVLAVLYVGFALAVAIWTMRAALDAVPVDLEEAAWLDGLGVFGGFRLVVLPNALPGLLTTAVTTFLFAWNDYWIALVFLYEPDRFPVGLALATVTRAPAVAVVAALPPLVVFAVLHRFFRFGGVGGALSGT